jgi:hypothetical protein
VLLWALGVPQSVLRVSPAPAHPCWLLEGKSWDPVHRLLGSAVCVWRQMVHSRACC